VTAISSGSNPTDTVLHADIICGKQQLKIYFNKTNKMNPPLELKVCAGFANRLRALVSGMCVAEDIIPLNDDGTRPPSLIVSWTPDVGIHTAPFEFLFDVTSLPPWVRLEDGRLQGHSAWATAKSVQSDEEWDFVYQRAGEKRPIRIKSHGQFYRADQGRFLAHLRSLRPAEFVQCMFEDLFAKLSGPIVGVHIRRGDNNASIKESPSELFWEAMTAYPEATMFYVATDSMEEREEAVRRFPGRILTGSATILSRNDPFGCREAMLDFYCLSRCSEILGSYYSSFSEMAAAYGGVPLRVMKISV